VLISLVVQDAPVFIPIPTDTPSQVSCKVMGNLNRQRRRVFIPTDCNVKNAPNLMSWYRPRFPRGQVRCDIRVDPQVRRLSRYDQFTRRPTR